MTNYIKHITVSDKARNKVTNKAAIFDLDHTIIKPIEGKKFSVTDSDWEFNSDNVISRLSELFNDRFDIIILSNQKIIKNDKDIKLWTRKIDAISKKINIPILALASLKDDNLRKPRTGLWTEFLTNYDKGLSFFCGDAGGLPKRKIDGKIVKKDFSDSDLKFALNVGLKFYHRDEFFYGVKGLKLMPSYIDFKKIDRGKYTDKIITKNTMIINIGYPGSGKSYFSKNHIKSNDGNIVYINRDTLKTIKKCVALCEKSAMGGEPIIIDNTNPSKDDRKLFIDIAKKYKYKVICLKFMTDKDICMHNNIYRSIHNKNIDIIPKIVYNIYKSKYNEPTKDEGFDKIEIVNFLIDNEKCDEDYFKFLF